MALGKEEINDKNVKAVQDKMEQRMIHGFNKYKTTTERTDLDDRQWLVHLQEELMDAAVYVQTILTRMDNKKNE